MQAVEFVTRVENGVIPIPHQYKDTFSDNVRVIVLAEEKSPHKHNIQKKKNLHYIGINMSGFQFNREEANERG